MAGNLLGTDTRRGKSFYTPRILFVCFLGKKLGKYSVYNSEDRAVLTSLFTLIKRN